MSRHQSHGESYGHPEFERSRIEVLTCPCGTLKEITIDAIGRARERCPKCDGIAPRRLRPEDVGAYTPQGALTNSPAVELRAEVARLEAEVRQLEARAVLPEIRPGQLRCQRCAKGVDGTRPRFCDDCRGVSMARTPTRATREKMAAASLAARARGVVFREKQCPCGVVFQPSAPNQQFHAPDCPARRGA